MQSGLMQSGIRLVFVALRVDNRILCNLKVGYTFCSYCRSNIWPCGRLSVAMSLSISLLGGFFALSGLSLGGLRPNVTDILCKIRMIEHVCRLQFWSLEVLNVAIFAHLWPVWDPAVGAHEDPKTTQQSVLFRSFKNRLQLNFDPKKRSTV